MAVLGHKESEQITQKLIIKFPHEKSRKNSYPPYLMSFYKSTRKRNKPYTIKINFQRKGKEIWTAHKYINTF